MKTKNSTKKKLAAFALPALLLSFGFYGMILWTGCGVNSGSVLVLGLMWVPAVSALFSKLMVDHSIRGMGWRIHAQSLPCLGIAYLLPLVLCGVVYGLAWSTGIGTLGEFSFSRTAVFATAGVVINCLAAMGEEIGWRGFLLTELRQLMPVRQASAVIGVIWFLYHAPVIVFSDYNNGNIPCSLLCFFVMVMAFTFAADALCVKARSFWPAVVLHASHNVFVQSIFDPITVTGRYTRFVTSEFGAGLALAYLAAALLLCAGMKNQQGKENPVKAVPHRTR